ncbi:branched-chain amino acid aminotransferase [Motilibacter rhizosphaerae]|uniref:Branched-chain amino acid aminotransferase n=1 Tax=Motilibacter rhizosphaerae TaxID=598652 RepID=A0A4Q7NRJ3_9ACTN|nr:aminotransferase class IV [Motilibacter rhizosphaerae]RZS89460.1 branched-chain amino acid aminotransferase [Motilibacter rhizosphaerae]
MGASSGVVVWLDGVVLPAEEARVGVLDHGFTVGDGVFETLAVRGGVPVSLTRHLARLARSAAALGLPEPEAAVVRSAVAELLGVVPSTGPHRLRITWTSGPGPLGSQRGDGPPTLLLALAPGGGTPDPVALATVPWVRNERSPLAGVKSTSYAENAVALAAAHAAGAGEAVLANTRGELCEGTGSNVLVAVGGRLLTPPLSSGCLAGVTREVLLDLGVVEEEVLAYDVLRTADEVLITSSTRDVLPAVRVDGREVAVGPLGRSAAAAYAARVAEEPDA